jgi:hypothetical protein
VEVENWTGLQLLQRIERAARPGPWDGVVPPAPEELPLPIGPLLPASPVESPPAPSTSVPRPLTAPAGGPRITLPDGGRSGPSVATVPPLPAPPATVSLPGVNVTVPPVITVVTTTPPTTRPPATTSTTRPPATTTTTACKPAGKSGKCPGGSG